MQSIFRNKQYISYIFVGSVCMTVFYYFSWMPFLLIKDMGLNAQIFSYLMIFPATFLFLGDYSMVSSNETHIMLYAWQPS